MLKVANISPQKKKSFVSELFQSLMTNEEASKIKYQHDMENSLIVYISDYEFNNEKWLIYAV